MPLSELDVRFARRLDAELVKAADQLRADLGSGSQMIRDDAAATGMNCVKYIGLIGGLEQARKLLAQLDEELTGRAPKKEKV